MPALAGAPTGPEPQSKMGAPIRGLTAAQLQRFVNGRVDFNRVLSDVDGLGPTFNKPSCGNCHNNPLGGAGSQTVTRFGLADKNGFNPLAELGGSLLQALASNPDCQELVPEEANVETFRVTNGAQGYGLIEAIPDADLLSNRDAQPRAIRGVAHMVTAFEDPVPLPPLPPTLHVGRFGWKAQVATILTFSADAALNEMGLTNRFVLEENAPNGNTAQLALCDTQPDPEDGPDGQGLHFIDRVTDFQRFLTHPPQTPRSGMYGEQKFNEIGCNICHTPTFTTSSSRRLEAALRNQVIHPYSDFLLHDMGSNSDFIVQGAGTELLIKTPALWGVRVRDPMWHNGQVAGGTFADRVIGAVALHDGGKSSDGHDSAIAFANLSQADKDALVAFLNSLGRLEFDADGDNDVQLNDFVTFAACFDVATTPNDPCAVHDINQSGHVGLVDFEGFLVAFEGIRRDCNSNQIIDMRDILDNPALDADHNGLLDACEPTCDSDTNGSGTVSVDDLLAIINGWGACPVLPNPCAADVNADHQVNVDDLLSIIVAWGPCL